MIDVDLNCTFKFGFASIMRSFVGYTVKIWNASVPFTRQISLCFGVGVVLFSPQSTSPKKPEACKGGGSCGVFFLYE